MVLLGVEEAAPSVHPARHEGVPGDGELQTLRAGRVEIDERGLYGLLAGKLEGLVHRVPVGHEHAGVVLEQHAGRAAPPGRGEEVEHRVVPGQRPDVPLGRPALPHHSPGCLVGAEDFLHQQAVAESQVRALVAP
jgi:hypothetical protein